MNLLKKTEFHGKKYSGITTVSATAMTGKISGVITSIIKNSNDHHCVSKCYIIHRETFAVKRFKTESETEGELEIVLEDVIHTVNCIRAGRKGKIFGCSRNLWRNGSRVRITLTSF